MMKSLVVKYPVMLSKSEDQINNYFKIMKDNGINKETAMKSLVEAPKLISEDLEKQIKEIVFLFELYHNMSHQQTMKIFKAFPFMLCQKPLKIQKFLAQFRKYKYTDK